MQRRLPLTILVALALAVTITLAMRSSTWRDGADDAVAVQPDSLAAADSAARVRAASTEEPPCVASRIGLPCR